MDPASHTVQIDIIHTNESTPSTHKSDHPSLRLTQSAMHPAVRQRLAHMVMTSWRRAYMCETLNNN
eukprot:807630-Pleurochrysis_carterae.AAC.2